MNEEYTDTIHRYLSDKMPSGERETFEKQLQTDPELREALELERILLAGIDRAGENSRRQTIDSVHQSLKKEHFFDTSTHKPFAMKRILAVAASLVVLAGAVWFFTLRETPGADTQALFEQNYKPQNDRQRALKIIESLESYGFAGAQTESDTLKIALELYEAGQYAEALAAFKSFAETHPENDTALYYIGVIHMNQERYAKAIEVLLPLARSENSALKNDALWNLALCYLKTENGVSDARDAFQTLASDNAYENHRGAKAVLEQLLPQ